MLRCNHIIALIQLKYREVLRWVVCAWMLSRFHGNLDRLWLQSVFILLCNRDELILRGVG